MTTRSKNVDQRLEDRKLENRFSSFKKGFKKLVRDDIADRLKSLQEDYEENIKKMIDSHVQASGKIRSDSIKQELTKIINTKMGKAITDIRTNLENRFVHYQGDLEANLDDKLTNSISTLKSNLDGRIDYNRNTLKHNQKELRSMTLKRDVFYCLFATSLCGLAGYVKFWCKSPKATPPPPEFLR